MSIEEKKNSAEQIGTLSSCLLEGDSEQKARERKIKRRALVISIVLQSVALVALVLVPLLGRTEKIVYHGAIPMPPYRAVRPHATPQHPPQQPPRRIDNSVFVPTRVPLRIVTRDPRPAGAPNAPDTPDFNGSVPIPGTEGGTEIFGKHGTPTPPADNGVQTRRVVRGGDVQQALLIRRVEPSYPTLARQTRVSGQVHLRAIISADGSIASLQVIDGHPLLVQSALDAVRQWRYQPTKLNGQPVEVETIITVVYTLGSGQ